MKNKNALLIFIFGFVVLFVGTWEETGITGKDEFWVTMRTPMEMIEQHSYWTLRLNDEVRLQKPPLVYWMMTGFYQLFGIHFWSARLVGVLSGAGMAAVTSKFYRRLFGRHHLAGHRRRGGGRSPGHAGHAIGFLLPAFRLFSIGGLAGP